MDEKLLPILQTPHINTSRNYLKSFGNILFYILIKNKYLFDLWIFYRVIASASPEDDCLLYKLANFKKSGQLVEAFNTGGSKEVIWK